MDTRELPLWHRIVKTLLRDVPESLEQAHLNVAATKQRRNEDVICTPEESCLSLSGKVSLRQSNVIRTHTSYDEE